MQYFPIVWLMLSLGITLYTAYDAHKWYNPPIRAWFVAATIYAPLHYMAASRPLPYEITFFVLASIVFAAILRPLAIYGGELMRPNDSEGAHFDDDGLKPTPTIASAHASTYTPPIKPITIEPITIEPEEDFTEGDEWEMFVPEGATA